VNNSESGFFQKALDRPVTEQLDMTTVPQWVSVPIPTIHQGDGKILQVPMMRRGQQQMAAISQDTVGERGQSARRIKMLDNLGGNHHVEAIWIIGQNLIGAIIDCQLVKFRPPSGQFSLAIRTPSASGSTPTTS